MTFVDLSGKKFGKLTVLNRCENLGICKSHPNGFVSFNCLCECGNEKKVNARHLKNGNIKSCGCLFDLKDRIFGRLKIIEKTDKRDRFGSVYWNCLCECGKTILVPTARLNNGYTKSCGCLNLEIVSKRIGILSPTWNHNLTDEERLIRRKYRGYYDWVKYIYKRDNYRCRVCNVYGNGKNLNAHHFNSFSRFPELRTKLSNGITLCENCHKEFHMIYGKRYNSIEQFYEWISSK